MITFDSSFWHESIFLEALSSFYADQTKSAAKFELPVIYDSPLKVHNQNLKLFSLTRTVIGECDQHHTPDTRLYRVHIRDSGVSKGQTGIGLAVEVGQN